MMIEQLKTSQPKSKWFECCTAQVKVEMNDEFSGFEAGVRRKAAQEDHRADLVT